MIRIARLASPASRAVNLQMGLWRGGQLYSISFMYNAMALIAGSWSAVKALLYKRDLSVWTSFKAAPQNQVTTLIVDLFKLS
jgi:hypothetical protein